MDALNHKKNLFIEPNFNELGFAFFAVRSTLIKAIEEFKPKAEGVLVDLGCGIMPYKEFLLENGKVNSYIGIDLPPTQYHNIVKPDLVWDGQHIPLENDSVDCLMATEFLEHYYETDHILSEIKRVLKPNGVFFFTVPCIWPLHEAPYDFHRFTPFCLTKKFDSAGFSKIDIRPLGGINMAIAIMGGLWLHFSGIRGIKHRIASKIFKPIYKRLIKADNTSAHFENNQIISGLYGFINK